MDQNVYTITQTKYPTNVKIINMAERSIYIFYVKYDFYPPYAWTTEIEKNVRGS